MKFEDEEMFADLEEEVFRGKEISHGRDLTKPAIYEIYKGILDQELTLKTIQRTLKDLVEDSGE